MSRRPPSLDICGPRHTETAASNRYEKTHALGNPEGVSLCGADDETRTRDPHLGKVMRYQLRYIRMHILKRAVRLCARYWDRTSDPYRVEVVLYR